MPYKPNHFYVIFLYKDKKGLLRSDMCAGSREIGDNVDYMLEVESLNKKLGVYHDNTRFK